MRTLVTLRYYLYENINTLIKQFKGDNSIVYNGNMYLLRQNKICSHGPRLLAVRRNYVSDNNKVELPNYNTNVNIHEHKLTRPVAKPKYTEEKWKWLKGLESRTKVNMLPD